MSVQGLGLVLRISVRGLGGSQCHVGPGVRVGVKGRCRGRRPKIGGEKLDEVEELVMSDNM